jgi:hypothetical protein
MLSSRTFQTALVDTHPEPHLEDRDVKEYCKQCFQCHDEIQCPRGQLRLHWSWVKFIASLYSCLYLIKKLLFLSTSSLRQLSVASHIQTYNNNSWKVTVTGDGRYYHTGLKSFIPNTGLGELILEPHGLEPVKPVHSFTSYFLGRLVWKLAQTIEVCGYISATNS